MMRKGLVTVKRDTCHKGEGLGKAEQVKAKGKERPFTWQADICWQPWIICI